MKVSSGKSSGGKGKTSGGILVYYKKEFKICVIPWKVIWIYFVSLNLKRVKTYNQGGLHNRSLFQRIQIKQNKTTLMQ